MAAASLNFGPVINLSSAMTSSSTTTSLGSHWKEVSSTTDQSSSVYTSSSSLTSSSGQTLVIKHSQNDEDLATVLYHQNIQVSRLVEVVKQNQKELKKNINECEQSFENAVNRNTQEKTFEEQIARINVLLSSIKLEQRMKLSQFQHGVSQLKFILEMKKSVGKFLEQFADVHRVNTVLSSDMSSNSQLAVHVKNRASVLKHRVLGTAEPKKLRSEDVKRANQALNAILDQLAEMQLLLKEGRGEHLTHELELKVQELDAFLHTQKELSKDLSSYMDSLPNLADSTFTDPTTAHKEWTIRTAMSPLLHFSYGSIPTTGTYNSMLSTDASVYLSNGSRKTPAVMSLTPSKLLPLDRTSSNATDNLSLLSSSLYSNMYRDSTNKSAYLNHGPHSELTETSISNKSTISSASDSLFPMASLEATPEAGVKTALSIDEPVVQMPPRGGSTASLGETVNVFTDDSVASMPGWSELSDDLLRTARSVESILELGGEQASRALFESLQKSAQECGVRIPSLMGQDSSIEEHTAKSPSVL